MDEDNTDNDDDDESEDEWEDVEGNNYMFVHFKGLMFLYTSFCVS